MEGLCHGALLVWGAVTELATHSGLALSRLTENKQDKTKAKYDHEAQISGSSGVLMVHKSKTERTDKHKQAGELLSR